MLDRRLSRIRARVDRIRASHRYRSLFGVGHHNFEFNPPLSENDVRAFETKWRIELPPDFRAFVTTIGNGGAGPYYGIQPLELWDELTWDDEPNEKLALERPCPLTPDQTLSHETWESALALAAGSEPYDGLLAVCTCGCTYFCTLVVSGPAYGRMCYVNADLGCEPPYFPEDDGFVSWYERWLDELEAGRDLSCFGFGAKGNEPVLRDLLLQDPSHSRRLDAAMSLGRLESLTAETIEALIEAARVDSSADVRATAVCALWRKGSDVDEQLFVEQLGSSDLQVVQASAFALLDRGVDHLHAELAVLLQKNEVEARTLGAYALGHCHHPDGVQALIDALSDENENVRIHVIQALRDLRARAALPALRELRQNESCRGAIRVNVDVALRTIRWGFFSRMAHRVRRLFK